MLDFGPGVLREESVEIQICRIHRSDTDVSGGTKPVMSI